MEALVGLQKTSLVDYPGKVAATLFFPGCNLRCPWCHNRELVLGGQDADLIPLAEAIEFLKRRKGVLGGVVLTGGEPLIRPDIADVIGRVKAEGFRVKLDTNGTRPEALQALLANEESTPDFIALDLKTDPEKFSHLAGADSEDVFRAIGRSASILAASSVGHEFRSLALPGGFFTLKTVEILAPLVDSSPWYFSAFRPGNCLDPGWNDFGPSDASEARKYAEKAISIGKDGRTR